MMNKVKAVVNGDRLECGKCNALLARRVQGYLCTVKDSAELEQDRTKLEIKCKHKDKGVYCNTVNEISL